MRTVQLFLLLLLGFKVTSFASAAQPSTELSIHGTHFAINGKPTFLLGCSYYAALGASKESITKDLDNMQNYGFNWIRIFATWTAFNNDISAVDAAGRARQPYFDKLRWLINECDRRGMVVDVTLARGDGSKNSPKLPDVAAQLQAVRTLIPALKDHRNWFIDLSNERNIQDKRFTSIADLRVLRDLVQSLDPHRLVTASHGGALSSKDQTRYVQDAHLNFLTVHAERDANSPAQTADRTKRILASFPRNAPLPLLYDEPFRRGYAKWNPTAADFTTDLSAARSAGAAGWCFHNGSESTAPDHLPARSFDLSHHRLFDQLDPEERKFLKTLLPSDSH